MAGILYVVATPIGNLEDVTLRALRILREVTVIAAEDTRRTAKLLQHYSISTRTTSLHEHNEREKTARLLDRLRSGESIALVSDAGTPAVSDPGQSFIAAARDAGIRVESVPGPSSVIAAISASGLNSAEFVFMGFAPRRVNDRKMWLQRIAMESRLVVFFEAPHRIRETLKALTTLIGGDRLIGVARELTKTHEELVVKPISQVVDALESLKGEFTLLLPAAEHLADPVVDIPSADVLRAELGQITESNELGRRDALRILATRHRMPVNELYRILQSKADIG